MREGGASTAFTPDVEKIGGMISAWSGWHGDPGILAAGAVAAVVYAAALRMRMQRIARRTGRRPSWPRGRIAAALSALAVGLAALESPLDTAADRAFAPHMLQHLLLTDVVAPLILLAAPLELALAALAPGASRRIVRALKSPIARFVTFPAFTWTLFVTTLWSLHAGPVFELALDEPAVHAAEHVAFLVTSLFFWLPVVAAPPTPWTDGPLAYPMRMLYVLLAMPAEGFLGFAIYGAPHVIYAHYRAAGLEDQRSAGELMWIGSGLAMLVAFLLVGREWGVAERRLGAQHDRALDRAAAP